MEKRPDTDGLAEGRNVPKAVIMNLGETNQGTKRPYRSNPSLGGRKKLLD